MSPAPAVLCPSQAAVPRNRAAQHPHPAALSPSQAHQYPSQAAVPRNRAAVSPAPAVLCPSQAHQCPSQAAVPRNRAAVSPAPAAPCPARPLTQTPKCTEMGKLHHLPSVLPGRFSQSRIFAHFGARRHRHCAAPTNPICRAHQPDRRLLRSTKNRQISLSH